MLKSGYEVPLDEIPDLLGNDELTESALAFYWRYRTMGWPYGPNWAEHPARLKEVIELLDPLDRIYHPRMM
ncbi:MAG: hypothetical protein VB025_09170 [Sphaerochaeta sp.]|nr:hypothetical protein [Sphaerochaeta sp.]